ncbi:MAG: hypothetical protein COB24_14815 [Hyphomicrobiales bacterium]|nr:MAG: hypothetical protein COB24_14815 [Hyphomicrobiales bacterium]
MKRSLLEGAAEVFERGQKIKQTEDNDVKVRAIHRFGASKIFNTDQGSQFTSWQWIDRLKSANIKISMDGKG